VTAKSRGLRTTPLVVKEGTRTRTSRMVGKKGRSKGEKKKSVENWPAAKVILSGAKKEGG